jgi:hypothetical protein
MEQGGCRSGFNRDEVTWSLPDGPMKYSFSRLLVALVSPFLGDLLIFCAKK